MLKSKVVLVTGGVGRIGTAICRSIVENHGRVVISDISEEVGKKLAQELGKETALFLQSDITDSESLDILIESAAGHFGKIDAAVHCAYPHSKQWGTKFEELQMDSLAEDLKLQLGNAIIFSQKILKYFASQGWGNLIHISSIQGVAAPKFEHYAGTQMASPIEYSAIKSGIIAITRWLAKYYANKNIRVNCISPGGILDQQPRSFLDRYKAACTSKGMLDAEDIVGTALFLLSNESKYINGQNLIVDDGWTL